MLKEKVVSKTIIILFVYCGITVNTFSTSNIITVIFITATGKKKNLITTIENI